MQSVQDGIDALLTDLSLSFNVGKNMTPVQVQQTRNLIILEKKYLSIPDLQVCFRRAKTGQYGKIYDCLDTSTVFGFIAQYEAEKTGEAENQSYIDHNLVKKKEDPFKKDLPREMHPESKKIVEEMRSRLNAQIQNEKQEALKKLGSSNVDYRNYSPEQKWMGTFDAMFKRKGKSVGGHKFVERNGVMMSISEYLSFRSKRFISLLNHETQNHLK